MKADSPLPPPPTPSESDQLVNTLCPSRLAAFFFFFYHTHNQTLYSNTLCSVECSRFFFFFSFELIHHATSEHISKFCFLLIPWIKYYMPWYARTSAWNCCVNQCNNLMVFTNAWYIQRSVLQTHIRYNRLGTHSWHSNDINEGGFRRSVLLSTVCTHTVLWSIMHVWWYVMLLVIATLLISFYCLRTIFLPLSSCYFPTRFYICLFFFTLLRLCFQLFLHWVSSILPVFASPLFLLFSSIATCLYPPPTTTTTSWALYLLLSSSLAFLHNVFLLSSPVRICICYVHFLHELAWHLLILPLSQPLTLIIAVFR